MGERELHNGDWDAAYKEYNQALADPGAPPEVRAAAQLGLGETLLQSGDFSGAKSALDTFLSEYAAQPQAPQAYFLRGEAKLGLSDWQGAIADFNAYQTMRPGLLDSYVYERVADAYLALSQVDSALDAYEKSTQGGRDPIALLALRERVALRERTLANSLLNNGQPELAAKAFTAALGQYQAILSVAQIPNYRATIEYSIAQTLFESGQKDSAHDQYNHVFMTYPASSEALESLRILLNDGRDVDQYMRGIVNFNQGQYEIALEAFNNYRAAIKPGLYAPDSYVYVAKSYHAIGNDPAALTELQVFFQRTKPEQAGAAWFDAMLEMAKVDADGQNTDEAFKTFEQLVSEHPETPQATDALAAAAGLAERLGDVDRAAAYYHRLATQYPTDSRGAAGLMELSLKAYQNGDYAAAEDLFASAGQTSGGDPAASDVWLGKVKMALGKQEEAKVSFSAAVAADSDGYYGLRAADILAGRAPFASPVAIMLPRDQDEGRAEAEAWIAQQFKLSGTPGFSSELPDQVKADPRFVRASELWDLGIVVDARRDFENVRQDYQGDPTTMYQMAIYFRDIGLYRSSILAAGRVLKLAGVAPLQAPPFLARLRYPTYFADLIIPKAKLYNLDPLLIFAVIWQESTFEGFATSSASAQGLMQIWPPTGEDIARHLAWPDYTPGDLQRPLVSVSFGTWLLADELKRFDQDSLAALAAYNAGAGRAADWRAAAKSDPDLFIELISVSETKDYVRQVSAHYAAYRALYGSN